MEKQQKLYYNTNGHHYHHHSEYQIPKNSINQTLSLPPPPPPQLLLSSEQEQTHNSSRNNNNNNHHNNESFISSSMTTTITGTFSHAFSNSNGIIINNNNDECSEKNDKISLSASLNYSITSNASMMTNTDTTLSDTPKFNCSDSIVWNDNNNDDLSADTGFENPSFRHLNDTNIVLIRDDELPASYYSKNATDVVVLRSKANGMGMGSNNNSMNDLSAIETPSIEQKQRLSSFKFENNNLSLLTTPNGSPSHYYSSNNNSINNNNSIPSLSKAGSHSSFGALMYGQIDEPLTTSNAVNVNNNVNVVTNTNKPAVTPRPASLLSGIFLF